MLTKQKIWHKNNSLKNSSEILAHQYLTEYLTPHNNEKCEQLCLEKKQNKIKMTTKFDKLQILVSNSRQRVPYTEQLRISKFFNMEI